MKVIRCVVERQALSSDCAADSRDARLFDSELRILSIVQVDDTVLRDGELADSRPDFRREVEKAERLLYILQSVLLIATRLIGHCSRDFEEAMLVRIVRSLA